MSDLLQSVKISGETSTVEFKERADKTLASEVCAFANARGGKVFLGIDDKGTIVGTDTSNSAKSRVQDTINKIKPKVDFGLEVDGQVLVIDVKESQKKPHFCSSGYYMRSGPNSQKMENDDILELLRDQEIPKYDTQVQKRLPLEENLDEETYARFTKLLE